jgi:hypothetical protein
MLGDGLDAKNNFIEPCPLSLEPSTFLLQMAAEHPQGFLMLLQTADE